MLNPERERVPPSRSPLRSAEPDQGFGDGSRFDGAHPDRQLNAASRVEVRSVAPDANPYMVLYSLFKTGIEGSTAEDR